MNSENKTQRHIWEGVTIKDGCYGYFKHDKERLYFVPCGSAVEVKNVSTCLEDDTKILELEFRDERGEIVTTDFPRESLTETGVQKLVSKGVQVNKKTATYLIQSIENSEVKGDASYSYVHNKLGFSTYKDKAIFKGHIGVGIDSKYQGDEKIQPTGSFELWLKMVKDCVVGNTPLETVLAMSAASLFIDYLYDDLNCENLIISVYADSSKGKSTAGQLFVSTFGSPKFGQSFAFSCADTPNAIINSIPSSYPTLVDEGSLLTKSQNITSFLYNLSLGKEKSRLTKEGNRNTGNTFHTSIFFSSEKSLLNMCDQNSGLLVRVLEFANITWTRNAQEADEIKRVVTQNYGHVGIMLAKKILETDKNDIIERFYNWHKTFVDRAREAKKYNGYTERISKHFAMIMLAGEHLMEVIGVEFDLDKMVEFLESVDITRTEEAQIGVRAMNHIMAFVQTNYSKFEKSPSMYANSNDLWGEIRKSPEVILHNDKVSKHTLYILESRFKWILEKGGFQDASVVLRNLKDLEILNSQDDRKAESITIGDMKNVKGYQLRLEEPEDDTEDNNDVTIVDTEEEEVDFGDDIDYNPIVEKKVIKKPKKSIPRRPVPVRKTERKLVKRSNTTFTTSSLDGDEEEEINFDEE